MAVVRAAVLLVAVSIALTAAVVTDEDFKKLQDAVKAQQETQKQIITSLARQVSQQQLYVEEMTRSQGDSGLKLTRLTRTGSKDYFSNTFSGSRIASIHEHSNYRGTVGMGELVAVLNGVEFRTRHNDYKMRMPHRTSQVYGATEDVPYPDVPPEVLAKPTIEEQIEEMREWFKAWQTEDFSKRDYRKYFKANLCYLEGAWTNSNGGAIDEPFQSDRHAIDAKSFFDLQSKIRYTSVTGRKSTNENYAYLPSTISDVDKYGNIIYSQWNYRILCHPIKMDVPVSRLRVEDDLATRVANGKSLSDHMLSRAARFSLYEDPKEGPFFSTKDSLTKSAKGNFLDKIMAEIPGKDNYKAEVVDDGFGQVAYAADANLPRFPDENTTLPEPLNAGYYHNAHKVIGRDAMGVSIRRRGYSDSNLYVAYNTRTKVTPITVMGKCKRNNDCTKKAAQMKRACNKNKKNCQPIPKCEVSCNSWTNRVSYAIPLELIYTTPLQTWNPHNLPIRSSPKTVTFGTRTGQNSPEKAYNGTSDRHYYMTPVEFFEANTIKSKVDNADTVKRGGVAVLDNKGDVKIVTQSGIAISTKPIPGVGAVRIRYPVMPLHIEGNTMYKDIQALADMTLKKNKYLRLYPDARENNGTIEEMFEFEMTVSQRDPPGPHIHTLELSQTEIDEIVSGKTVKVSTTEVAGHEHELELFYNTRRKRIEIRKCDGSKRCWDAHSNQVICPDCPFAF